MSPVGRQQKPLSNGPKYQKIGADFTRPTNESVKGSPPPQAQNVSQHRIFVFGSDENSIKDVERGSIELTEMRSRKENYGAERIGELQKNHYVDHDVVPDDSLAKLSLRYGCTITQLKQANGIYNDQDLFAHKILKIPVYPHSMIWETLGTQNSSKDSKGNFLNKTKRSYSDPNLQHFTNGLNSGMEIDLQQFNGASADYSISDDDDDNIERRNLLDARPRVSRSLNETNNACEEYLETVDKDIQELSNKVQSSCNSSDVLGHSLKYMQPNINNKSDDKKLGQVGWISYKGILFTLCVVAVLVPLMYILYFKVISKKR